MALGPGIVGGHFTPFVDTSVYVQASVQVTVPIAEAGAVGKLTLLKDELELAASASLVRRALWRASIVRISDMRSSTSKTRKRSS